MSTRVDLYFKQDSPTARNGIYRAIRLFAARANAESGSNAFVTDTQLQWLSENNVRAALREDIVDYHLLFDHAEDALAFKLRFGL